MELGWVELTGTDGHTAGRQLLARMYRQYAGEEMPEILCTPQGKPYFSRGPWHFSVSHTQQAVFCALSRKNIGLDAEKTDRKPDLRLAQRWLSPMELAQWEAAADQHTALLKFWVLKEAYAKLTGFGIGNHLKSTEFSLENSEILEKNGHFIAILEDE